jgi:hypothetical protein
MELINGIVGLAMLAYLICGACFLLFGATLGLIELFDFLTYPLMRLRCLIAGAEDRFAPLWRLLLASLASKLTAALLVAAIALYLGASFKTTAIWSVLAFLFIG